MTASGILRTGAGLIDGFLVATGTPTITIYDGTDTSGTLLLNGLVTVAGTPYPFPALVEAGAYVVMSGTGDVTFFYN